MTGPGGALVGRRSAPRLARFSLSRRGMNSLNVIYVGTLPPHPGGSALSGIQLAGAIAGLGHRVRALGPVTRKTIAKADRLAADYPAIEFHRFEVPHYEIHPDRKHGAEYRRIEGAALREMLPALIEVDRPDVLLLGRETYAWHLPDPDVTGDIPCLLRAAGGGVNGLLEGATPDGFEARLRLPHGHVVPGRHMVATLESIGVDGVHFVENPVNLDLFRPTPKRQDLLRRFGIDPSGPVVAHVSNLKHVKRPGDFVEAAGAVLRERPDTTFLLVGDGPLRPALDDRCHELGIDGSVRFTGWVDYAEMPELYSISDVVVMCSEREGLARVYLETLACERLLIASDIPPAREVVEEGVNGLLYDLGDVEMLSTTIVRGLRDPELRGSLGRQGRAGLAAHSLDRVGTEYVAILRELAVRHSNGTKPLLSPRSP